MTESSKNVPKLRFPGYTEAWELRKFEEMYNVMSGFAFKLSDYSENGVPIVNGESINHGEVVSNNWNYLPEKFRLEYKTFLLKKDDIVLGLNRPITNGNLKIAKIPSTLDKSLLYQRAGKVEIINETDLNFSYQILNREVYKFVLKEAQGSDQPFISTTKLKKWSYFIPKKEEEQTKIGNFFKQLDKTIALHQRKLTHLQNMKASLLQKMFPKNGEEFPEIRFPFHGGKWKQFKLEEIFKIIDGDRGKNYPGESDFLNEGNTLFLDTGNVRKNGFDFSVKKYISKEKDKLLRSGKLELFDFVLTSRGTLGNVAYYEKCVHENNQSVRINSAMLILRPILHNEVSDKFMLSVLRGSIINKFMVKNHVGSAQPHITKRDLSQLIVNIPSTIQEQQQIGLFFQQLDNLITLHQRKLTHLNNQKKSLLQQMFI